LRENNELEKELNEMNEKVKSMHLNWYRDKKLKSYGGQGFLWQPVNFNISQVFKY
jgi:hypothetical protein